MLEKVETSMTSLQLIWNNIGPLALSNRLIPQRNILCVRKSYINNFKCNCNTNHVYKVTYITLNQVLNKKQSKHRLFFRLTVKAKQILWTDISCLGGVFTKNTNRETTNLVSKLVFFANTPPSMIYLFNYTIYYCFRFTLEHFRVSNWIIHVTLRIKVKKTIFRMNLAVWIMRGYKSELRFRKYYGREGKN
jgi:hypothetical protein